MADTTFLNWPFFEDVHRALASDVDAWASQNVAGLLGEDEYEATQSLVRALGEAGWLKHAVVAPHGGANKTLDVRTLCIIRETLARYEGLADFAFAMQGLGSGPISLFGTDALKKKYLPDIASGASISALAMSEEAAGSNVAAMETKATWNKTHYIIDGEKTWISNAGIASVYTVFARTDEAPGSRGLSAFAVEADTKGLTVTENIKLLSPHPLGTLRFDGCHVPVENMIGEPGDGFKIAMATLDVFRSTVAAAALGFARRALDEARARCKERVVFDKPLASFQMTQQKIADMAVEIDASALLVYRAAWTKDCEERRVTREAAMAKLYATEAAQRVIDMAVQLFGGQGVVAGNPVEALYRDIRPLRIYEGTSEIQKLIIAKETLRD